jgi:hypothetical protein
MEISWDRISGYSFRSIDEERVGGQLGAKIKRSGRRRSVGRKNKKKWHKTGIKAGKVNTKLSLCLTI